MPEADHQGLCWNTTKRCRVYILQQVHSTFTGDTTTYEEIREKLSQQELLAFNLLSSSSWIQNAREMTIG